MFIAIDFDGTIVDHCYPGIGKPVPKALEYMRDWQSRGAKLILFTMRSHETLLEARMYLKDEGIKLFAVNKNPTQGSWTTSPKPYAHFYIDDAAAGVPKITLSGFKRPVVHWEAIANEIDVAISQYNTL